MDRLANNARPLPHSPKINGSGLGKAKQEWQEDALAINHREPSAAKPPPRGWKYGRLPWVGPFQVDFDGIQKNPPVETGGLWVRTGCLGLQEGLKSRTLANRPAFNLLVAPCGKFVQHCFNVEFARCGEGARVVFDVCFDIGDSLDRIQ